MESLAVVPGVFAVTVTDDNLMLVAPYQHTGVDAIFVCIHLASRGDRRLNQRENTRLLDVLQHLNHDLSTALNHPEEGQLLFLQAYPAPEPLSHVSNGVKSP
jgi:hypothetical protein